MNELQSQADALAGQVLASSCQQTVSQPIRYSFRLLHMHLLLCLSGRQICTVYPVTGKDCVKTCNCDDACSMRQLLWQGCNLLWQADVCRYKPWRVWGRRMPGWQRQMMPLRSSYPAHSRSRYGPLLPMMFAMTAKWVRCTA